MKVLKSFLVGILFTIVALLISPTAFANDHLFEQPSNYPTDSSERVIAELIFDWQKENFREMRSLFDPAWEKNVDNPEEFIKSYLFGTQKPIGFYTTGTTEVSDKIARITYITLLVPPFRVGFEYDKLPYEVSLVKQKGQWKIDLNSLRSLKRQFCTQQSGIENCIDSD